MATNHFKIYSVAEFLERASYPEFTKMISHEHSSIMAIPVCGTSEINPQPTNLTINGLKQIPCGNHSDVVLLNTKDGSGYVNANYVSGFDMKKKFIATEWPMANILDNFWSMVWQENVRVIVMLTSTEEEFYASNVLYFPYNQDNTMVSDILVTIDEINSENFYTETILSIASKTTGEIRKVHHFKYSKWHKYAVPEAEGFLNFLLAVNKQYQKLLRSELFSNNQFLPGPIIIHGSADIGRAATFCAVDTCLYQLVATISVSSVVLKIRQQRSSSIVSLGMYNFINHVLLYFLITIKSKRALFDELRSHLTAKDLKVLNHSLINFV